MLRSEAMRSSSRIGGRRFVGVVGVVGFTAAASAALWAAPSAAQGVLEAPAPADSNTVDAAHEEAAAAFEAAERARVEGRLADAERALRRSLALDARPATAFNLAAVLADLGRHRDACAEFERVLGGTYGLLSEERARIVQERLRASRAAIARVRLRVDTHRPVELSVDGERRAEAVLPDVIVLEVDPGLRHLRAIAPGWTLERSLALEAGDDVAVDVRVPRDPALGETSAVTRRRRRWAVVAASVAVVVGATLAAVIATRPRTDRVEDPVFGSVWTLRAP